MMYKLLSLALLAYVHGAIGHGDHESSGPAQGETIQEYAQRHMSSEHHIDSFDARSFFQLHDLNRDGVWNRDEIEAIYGVHHVYSQKKSKDEIEHRNKANLVIQGVLQKLDLNSDGVVTPEELEEVGLAGLPNFEGLGADGHHYDVESEFFLHHEEQFHSTPETQTDESYNHPEDLEHFAMHETIELKETEREAQYQGLTVEELTEALKKAAAEEAAAKKAKPPIVRVAPPEKQDPEVKYKDAKTEGDRKGEWGSGSGGYKPPTEAGDKLRKNLPYKYKFRRNWGDF